MAASSGDLFAFLEADVTSPADGRPLTVGSDADPVLRALELATDEWSEPEAGAELARLFAPDALRAGQARLLAALHRSPFVEVRGIRAARVLWCAIGRCGQDRSTSGD